MLLHNSISTENQFCCAWPNYNFCIHIPLKRNKRRCLENKSTDERKKSEKSKEMNYCKQQQKEVYDPIKKKQTS